MVKVLHCADVHLNMPFFSLDEERAKRRRGEVKESFFSFVDTAKEKGFPVATIAGDFFDSDNVTFRTVKNVADKMASAPEVQFFISPGNHDFYSDASFYALYPWPENVHIFPRTPSRISLPDLGTDVYGCGFSNAFQREPLLSLFSPEDPSRINILVLHGDLGVRHSSFNPMPEEMIAKSGFDAVLSGHIHKRTGFLPFGQTFFLYPGSLDAGGFDERGPHGFYECHIEKGLSRGVFVPAAKREYREIPLPAGAYRTDEEAVEAIREIVFSHSPDDLYKIVLTGETPRGVFFDPARIASAAKEFAFWAEVSDESTEMIDYSGKMGEMSLKGGFIRSLVEEMTQGENGGEQQKIAKLALKYGYAALCGEEAEIVEI